MSLNNHAIAPCPLSADRCHCQQRQRQRQRQPNVNNEWHTQTDSSEHTFVYINVSFHMLAHMCVFLLLCVCARQASICNDWHIQMSGRSACLVYLLSVLFMFPLVFASAFSFQMFVCRYVYVCIFFHSSRWRDIDDNDDFVDNFDFIMLIKCYGLKCWCAVANSPMLLCLSPRRLSGFSHSFVAWVEPPFSVVCAP